MKTIFNALLLKEAFAFSLTICPLHVRGRHKGLGFVSCSVSVHYYFFTLVTHKKLASTMKMIKHCNDYNEH